MSVNPSSPKDSFNSLNSQPLSPLDSNAFNPPAAVPSLLLPDHYQRGFGHRRSKAATLLTLAWGGTIALYYTTWGSWLTLTLAALTGLHLLRVVLTRPLVLPDPLAEDQRDQWPRVSLLVAAKNEEQVIGKLVQALCNLDYPRDRYEVWIIDDHSTDSTPDILKALQQDYDQLQVFRRDAGAKGGKSGALNQVVPLTQGEVLAVFDADAQVPPDILQQVLPLFVPPQVGAVQLRKSISNADRNFWTQGQAAEMMLDAYFQQQRIACGGVGELRGNGQFLRRSALESCGGFNEETITDDLDLTIRLHLEQWDIASCLYPTVGEEGVTGPMALWHQRNRWAEGGYQRYLDYWRLIARNRLGTAKTIDLLTFWISQYLYPTIAVPDLLMAVLRNRMPLFTPVAGMTITLSLVGMFMGVRQVQQHPQSVRADRSPLLLWLGTVFRTLQGVIYMFHWFAVMAGTTARVSFRPKRLKWVKTVHHG
ncbi:glycosyltransferase [Prochlorothrix hollandica]|uniref:glycosyltransferase n=1 Tax=Prochlorothrix hollandica TaxID=1223 RepID=UPI003341CAB4